jgi:prevent-host-death family protein
MSPKVMKTVVFERSPIFEKVIVCFDGRSTTVLRYRGDSQQIPTPAAIGSHRIRIGARDMKIESLREVKKNFSRVIDQLNETGPVVITRNGASRAILLPVDDSTDLESLLLSASPRFWKLFDRAAKSRGWTALEDL